MKIIISLLVVFISTSFPQEARIASQSVDFTSSNLPIIVIDTHGQTIPTSGPRIIADMGVIDNGEGIRNQITDPFNNYQGKISIEVRGASSAGWSKKSYNVETQNEDGSNLNVSLLGLPEENDWVLYGPYYDRSFVRNVLSFEIARKMGWYASGTKFFELVLNGEYQGIYVLLEKIKRDRNRVDIAELNPDEISGDDVTGGYIIKIDKEPWQPGFDSKYPPQPGSSFKIRYQYHDPDGDEIVTEQEAYIQNYVDTFETLMYSGNYTDPLEGYAQYIDVASFVDNFILNEISRNVDGYRLSTYFYKDKNSNGGRLTAGPPWDFNFSFGNVGYYEAEQIEGWQIDYFLEDSYFHRRDSFQAPFWWAKLLADPQFKEQIFYRWQELRQDGLHLDSLYFYLDELEAYLYEAQERNFQIWIGPGDPKTPDDGWFPPDYPIGDLETFDDEIEYLKNWLTSRTQWMDEEISTFDSIKNQDQIRPGRFDISRVYPNPFNSQITVEFTLNQTQPVQLLIYDIRGREISVLLDQTYPAGAHSCEFNLNQLPSGIYLIRLAGENQTDQTKIFMIK